MEKFQTAQTPKSPEKSIAKMSDPKTPEKLKDQEKTPSSSHLMDVSIFSPPKPLEKTDFSKMRQAENAISETTSEEKISEKKSSTKTESGESDWMTKELTKDSPETAKRKEEMTGTLETLSLDKVDGIRDLIDMKRKCTPNKGIYNPSKAC